MALTTYYMLCRPSDNVILESRLTDDFGVENYADIMVVRSATFSVDAGDSPDVLASDPLPGGTFVSPGTYNPPAAPVADPYLKVSDWSGNGGVDPDDGVWEMESDGTNSCTLTVKKWDRTTDTALNEVGDKFSLNLIGSPDCPCGRITLDSNGEATIVLAPLVNQKGESSITLRGINVSYLAEGGRVRFV